MALQPLGGFDVPLGTEDVSEPVIAFRESGVGAGAEGTNLERLLVRVERLVSPALFQVRNAQEPPIVAETSQSDEFVQSGDGRLVRPYPRLTVGEDHQGL